MTRQKTLVRSVVTVSAFALAGLASISCGAEPTSGHPTPSIMRGFQFEGRVSTSSIHIDGSVRCVEAAHNLYISAPDPIPSATRTKVVSIIIGSFQGDGVYRNFTDNTEDPKAVLVELLDYSTPHDYTIGAIGESGYIRVSTVGGQIAGHIEGVTRGPLADSVKGDWTCRLSPPSGTVAVTASPSVPPRSP